MMLASHFELTYDVGMPEPVVDVTCPSCLAVRGVRTSNLKAMKSHLCKPCSARRNGRTTVTHDLERHPLYQMWTNIKKRIDTPTVNPKNYTYMGLDMDPEWRDVRLFVAWAVSAGWEKGLSIERNNLSRGYWPDNCSFIPVKHQARNRRDNSVTPEIAARIQSLVAQGMVRYQVAKAAAEAFGIPLSTAVKVAYGYNWK